MSRIIGLIGGGSGCALSSELHKRGLKVAAVIGKSKEPGYDIADYVLVCDLSEHERIIEYFKQLNVKNVIFGTGPFAAIELCRELINRDINVNIDLEKFEFCKNKYLLNETMRKHGIITPEDKLIDKEDDLKIISEQLSFPVVLKSIKDLVAPQKIDDKEVFITVASDMLTKEEQIMIEEYIRGNDVTVFVSNSEELIIQPIYWSKGSEEQLKGFETSYSKPLSRAVEEELIGWCKKINDIVQIPGVYRIDLIASKEKFYFFEINTLIVSALTTSTYAIKFSQAELNRAELIIDYALKKFGISTKRIIKRLTITGDDILINSVEQNALFVNVSGIRELYKNNIYDGGINFFYNYLEQQLETDKYDKEFAKNALLCLISSDAEVVAICEPIDERRKIVMETAKFLHKMFTVNETPINSLGGGTVN